MLILYLYILKEYKYILIKLKLIFVSLFIDLSLLKKYVNEYKSYKLIPILVVNYLLIKSLKL